MISHLYANQDSYNIIDSVMSEHQIKISMRYKGVIGLGALKQKK